jgi:hypothetical protein
MAGTYAETSACARGIVHITHAVKGSGGFVKLDKAGYFVIVPLPAKGSITVEHYAYDHTLLRTLEGTTARATRAVSSGTGSRG